MRHFLYIKKTTKGLLIILLMLIVSSCVTRNIPSEKPKQSPFKDNYDRILKSSHKIAPVVDGRGKLISLGSTTEQNGRTTIIAPVKKTITKKKLAPVVNKTRVIASTSPIISSKRTITSKTANKPIVRKQKLAPVVNNTGTFVHEKERVLVKKTVISTPTIEEEIYDDKYYQDNDSSYKKYVTVEEDNYDYYQDNDDSYRSYTRRIVTNNDKSNDDEYYPLYKYGEKGSIDKSSDENARGVYEPFTTDNAVPFVDNEDDFYNDTFMYEY